MRKPIQALVLPFMYVNNIVKYAVFKRSNGDIWQFISGGSEDEENPFETAKRECEEEAAITNGKFFKLDSFSTIPASIFPIRHTSNWGEDCFVIFEYKFAVLLNDDCIKLSEEHLEYKWLSYLDAINILTFDSNKTALTELNDRIDKGKMIELY